MSFAKIATLPMPFMLLLGNRIMGTVDRYRPRYIPIAYKLALVLTLLISTGMTLLGLIIVSNQTYILERQINSFGESAANQLGESSKELILSDDALGLMMVTKNFGNNGNILGSAIYSEKGELLTVAGIIPCPNILQTYVTMTHPGSKNHSVEWRGDSGGVDGTGTITFISHIYFDKIIIGHALVTFSQESMDAALQQTIQTITMVTLLMVVLSIIIAFITSKRFSRPINTLMTASVAIGNGGHPPPIDEGRNDEIGFLNKAFNKMNTSLLEKSKVENAFSRFMSNNVAKHILSSPNNVELGGKSVEGTVLFADIVGFTSFSENLPANEVLDMLNEYFTYISTVSSLFNGTIDKYMGDCAMIIFGVPETDNNHKFNAMCCAVMIQELMACLNANSLSRGKPAIRFRIGVNSGSMVAGNMGSVDKMQYTVVGDTVNLASRLQSEAKKDQVLITEDMVRDPALQGKIVTTKLKPIHLRGISEMVSIYNVERLSPKYQARIKAQITSILELKWGVHL
jgi:adenylate cyclase